MQVKVIKQGYINNRRAYPGDIIDVDPKQFSENWMEKVDSSPSEVKETAPKKEEKKSSPSDSEVI